MNNNLLRLLNYKNFKNKKNFLNTDRNTGCALLRASDFPYSSLDVYILVSDVNSKTFRQHLQLPIGLNELLIPPKYGDIDLVDIISITPDEDAYYYYRF